jgi:hypothetical protein
MAEQVATQPTQTKDAEDTRDKSSPQPLGNPFAEIDELMSDKKAEPTPKPKPDTNPEPKAQDKGQQQPQEKPSEKQPQKPDTKPESTNLKTLREKYESSTKKVKELESEVQKYKQPQDDPDKKAFAERIDALEKRRADLERALEETAFERSDRYKQEFETPLRVAIETGKELVEGIELVDAEGNRTKGTEGMFLALCRMDRNSAKNQAKELFGEDWTEVMANYGIVDRAKKAAENAIAEHRTSGLEREKERKESYVKKWEEVRKTFKQHISEAIEKHPDLFKPADDDARGKDLIAKGMEMADSAFGPRNGIPTPDVVARDAAVRNKAGGYDYLAYKWRKAEKRIAELETKLNEFEDSEPGEGSGKRTPKSESKTWDQEIEELAVG